MLAEEQECSARCDQLICRLLLSRVSCLYAPPAAHVACEAQLSYLQYASAMKLSHTTLSTSPARSDMDSEERGVGGRFVGR